MATKCQEISSAARDWQTSDFLLDFSVLRLHVHLSIIPRMLQQRLHQDLHHACTIIIHNSTTMSSTSVVPWKGGKNTRDKPNLTPLYPGAL